MDEWNKEIEKYWRDRFADEVESCLMTLDDDLITKWFNNNNRSPTSGKKLNLFVLYKNNDMRSRCIEWKELHTIKEVLK